MTQSLNDTIALVTGAGGGIGRSICAKMHEAGATVIATDLAESAPACPADQDRAMRSRYDGPLWIIAQSLGLGDLGFSARYQSTYSWKNWFPRSLWPNTTCGCAPDSRPL